VTSFSEFSFIQIELQTMQNLIAVYSS